MTTNHEAEATHCERLADDLLQVPDSASAAVRAQAWATLALAHRTAAQTELLRATVYQGRFLIKVAQ